MTLTFSTLKSRYFANSLYNLDGNYDVMNKINRAEYDVIISILLKATKECSALKIIITEVQSLRMISKAMQLGNPIFGSYTRANP